MLKIGFIVIILTTLLNAYKFDGVRSGITMYQLSRNYRHPAYFAGNTALNSSNHEGSYTNKNIMGEQAIITLSFTAGKGKLYKTTVLWWNRFRGVLGVDKKKKDTFFKKVRTVLRKKYGKPKHRNKKYIFYTKDKSTITLSQDATSVKLVYLDTKLSQQAKKEKRSVQKKKNNKEYRRNYNIL